MSVVASFGLPFSNSRSLGPVRGSHGCALKRLPTSKSQGIDPPLYRPATVSAAGVPRPARETHEQTSHLSWLVRKTGEAAPGADAWSRRRRARRALDDIVQSWDDHTGAPRRACA